MLNSGQDPVPRAHGEGQQGRVGARRREAPGEGLDPPGAKEGLVRLDSQDQMLADVFDSMR